jgi:hypothetical protein
MERGTLLADTAISLLSDSSPMHSSEVGRPQHTTGVPLFPGPSLRHRQRAAIRSTQCCRLLVAASALLQQCDSRDVRSTLRKRRVLCCCPVARGYSRRETGHVASTHPHPSRNTPVQATSIFMTSVPTHQIVCPRMRATLGNTSVSQLRALPSRTCPK